MHSPGVVWCEVAVVLLFRDVLDAAILVARAHDRQPSAANAEKLDAAWRRILVLDRIEVSSSWRGGYSAGIGAAGMALERRRQIAAGGFSAH
jgi:hypothetical protein